MVADIALRWHTEIIRFKKTPFTFHSADEQGIVKGEGCIRKIEKQVFGEIYRLATVYFSQYEIIVEIDLKLYNFNVSSI